MKKIFVLGLTVLILAFGFISCDTDGGGGQTTVIVKNNSSSPLFITMCIAGTFNVDTSWSPSSFNVPVGGSVTTHKAETNISFSVTSNPVKPYTTANTGSWQITFTFTDS